MGAGSGHSFLCRHTSLVCLPMPLALARSIDLHGLSFSLLTKIPTHMWWWGHLRTPKRLLSFFYRSWGTLCSAGYTDTCGHQCNPRPTQPISFQKTQQPAKNKRAIPRNLWTQMAVFLELGMQNRKEERPGLRPGATGMAALPGNNCFQKGRKLWVAGDLPERALCLAWEGSWV